MAPSRRLRPSTSTSSLPRVWPTLTQQRQGHGEPTLAELVRLEQEHHTSLDPNPEDALSTGAARALVRRGSDPATLCASGPLDMPDPAADRPHLRSLSSSPLPLPAKVLSHTAPGRLLLPPHYGRPVRPSSPDALATLLRPVLASLSRPASPAMSSLSPGTPAPSSPTRTQGIQSGGGGSGNDLPSADRSSSSLPAQFPPREPTDPAPTVESQGFVLYVGSLVAYVTYLIWALLPEPWLEAIGIEWYPAREWALLVPAWVVMLVAFVYSGYFCLNLYNTPPLCSGQLVDAPGAFVAPPLRPPFVSPLEVEGHHLPRSPDHSASPSAATSSTATSSPTSSLHAGKSAPRRPPTPLWAHSVLLPPDALPPLYDLPLDVVNRVLYGD